jgi:DNA repair exonuclease SbcCD ATPase subunit
LEGAKARADELKVKIATLEEDKRKAEKLQVRINNLEEGKKKADELQARLKALEEEKKTAEALQARVITLEEEKNKAQGLGTRIVELEEEKIKTEELRKKIKELEEEKKKTETLQGKIQELQWRETHLFNSSYVLNKLGIREVLWRSGNSQADLINEKMLYEEAKKLNITPDVNEYKGIVEKYKFDGDQANFLYRYMIIFAFINAKLTDLPTEDVIEQLMVQYDEENKYTKIVLASELQSQAKSGISFEEIYNLYPDLVTVDIVKFEDLGKNIQEKVRQIPVGGIGVIWSEEGYRILKPTSRKLSLKPFQELQPAAKEKIKGYINDLIRVIEREAK